MKRASAPSTTPVPPKRFYVETPLTAGASLTLPENLQHRLLHVLRKQPGDIIRIFNNSNELFEAELEDKKCRIVRLMQALPTPTPLPPLTLALGLPKREAWETALRQATEMGVTHIIPLATAFSQVKEPANPARQQTLLIEAAEQCERLSLPHIAPVTTLEDFLAAQTTPVAWAYEREDGAPQPLPASCSTLLVGPEGGFAPAEVSLLAAHPQIHALSLGPTILRVDTAVVAGLARLSAR
jgi:16S rRNA (uracil1498-N3)-methyltransferase